MKGGERVPDFEEIYQQYFADVYRYALALSRDSQMAEELTQATFFKALTAIGDFRGECQLRVWLCQIARNEYRSLLRTQARVGPMEEQGKEEHLEERFSDQEDARKLHALLHRMPEPYKEVFSLRTFGELPYTQIGELFQKSESWARVTYFRARQKLKEEFDGT